jgi:prepilin-type N-terminal cleavage/methylation domain-containing protein
MRRSVQRLWTAEDGFTLAEMLVVVAILGIVIAGLTALFMGGLHAQTDQTNRTQAQLDGRVALDKMRREIRCAAGVSSTALPRSVTVSIPGYCPSPTSTTLSNDVTVPSTGTFVTVVSSIAGFNLGSTAKNEILIAGSTPVACTGADSISKTFTGCSGGTPGTYVAGTPVGSSVTWCTTTTGPSYSLKHFVGGAAVASPSGNICSGTGGVTVTNSLTSNSVFGYNRSSIVAPATASSASGGSLDPGTYYYDVTAVTPSGEVSGTVVSCLVSGSQNCHLSSWGSVPGATSYNIYGRDNGSTPPRLSPVSGQNTSAEAPQGLRLIGTVPAGTTSFDDTNAVDTAVPGLQQPPLGTISVSLVTDATPADAKQSFTLNDAISMRNSGRY